MLGGVFAVMPGLEHLCEFGLSSSWQLALLHSLFLVPSCPGHNPSLQKAGADANTTCLTLITRSEALLKSYPTAITPLSTLMAPSGQEFGMDKGAV